jgi:hypothetical protein
MLTLREATAHGFRPVMVYTQLALARVLKLTGEPKRAQTELRKAVALSKQLGLLREESEARENLASLLYCRPSDTDAAAENQGSGMS